MIARRQTEHGSGSDVTAGSSNAPSPAPQPPPTPPPRPRRDDIHEGFLALACCLICWRRLETSLSQSDSDQSPSPPRGASPGRAVARQPGPLDPDLLVVVEQTLPPDLVEQPGPLPLLEATVRRRGAADPGRAQRVPLHPGAQHEQDRVHRVPVGNPRPVTAQGMLRPTRAATARLEPTASPASANHRRSRQDPSKPPSLADFSNEVRLRYLTAGPCLAG